MIALEKLNGPKVAMQCLHLLIAALGGQVFTKHPGTGDTVQFGLVLKTTDNLAQSLSEEMSKLAAEIRAGLFTACVELPLPNSVEMVYRVSDPKTNLSIRMICVYDAIEGRNVARLDCGFVRQQETARIN